MYLEIYLKFSMSVILTTKYDEKYCCKAVLKTLECLVTKNWASLSKYPGPIHRLSQDPSSMSFGQAVS